MIEYGKNNMSQIKEINKTLVDLLDWFPKESMGYKSINQYINLNKQFYKKAIDQNKKMNISQQKFITTHRKINDLISDRNQKINEKAK
jgi:hypothetical protein